MAPEELESCELMQIAETDEFEGHFGLDCSNMISIMV